MLVTCEEMRQAEEAAFARGVRAEDLMEDAGRGIAEIIRQFHKRPGRCLVFCGKGHNAGDGLVAARHLASWGWRIDLRFAFPESSLAPLTAKKLTELPRQHIDTPASGSKVVLDGLLGIGARGEPRGEIASAIRSINRIRDEEGAWVLAIDIPSGLDAGSGVPAATCVRADLTATIACVKDCLVADPATDLVGRLAVVELKELPPPKSALWQISTPSAMQGWLPPRSFDMHKGDSGRVGILAGSPGFTGAARLCSAAALHAGAGLVTVLAKPDYAGTLAASCAPEVMVKTVNSYADVHDLRFDALAIGPGLGLRDAAEVVSVIETSPQPMIVDADALNIVARNTSVLKQCSGPRLLTPHPGEMERLFAQADRSRRDWLEAFLAEFPITLLLKGARTLIGNPQSARFINTTGNPGMASGGMGDVLTGVCAALVP
ncbi:MAG TPA: NAD(P)H-hydrate dehydratase, partial [Terrimicrobiaceae bacterium]|nr:NAD(P)H-hydrate dehydratase [Terrimicrobiaceae bacterium]